MPGGIIKRKLPVVASAAAGISSRRNLRMRGGASKMSRASLPVTLLPGRAVAEWPLPSASVAFGFSRQSFPSAAVSPPPFARSRTISTFSRTGADLAGEPAFVGGAGGASIVPRSTLTTWRVTLPCFCSPRLASVQFETGTTPAGARAAEDRNIDAGTMAIHKATILTAVPRAARPRDRPTLPATISAMTPHNSPKTASGITRPDNLWTQTHAKAASPTSNAPGPAGSVRSDGFGASVVTTGGGGMAAKAWIGSTRGVSGAGTGRDGPVAVTRIPLGMDVPDSAAVAGTSLLARADGAGAVGIPSPVPSWDKGAADKGEGFPAPLGAFSDEGRGGDGAGGASVPSNSGSE